MRDAELAKAETAVFLDLIDQLRQAGIRSTVSFDLSHIGSIVSPSLALENDLLMADALVPLGTALMISAEGSERTHAEAPNFIRITCALPTISSMQDIRSRLPPTTPG